jgi:hypothetical protein
MKFGYVGGRYVYFMTANSAPSGGNDTAHGVSSVPFDPCGLHLGDEHRQGSPPGKVLGSETYPHDTVSTGQRK